MNADPQPWAKERVWAKERGKIEVEEGRYCKKIEVEERRKKTRRQMQKKGDKKIEVENTVESKERNRVGEREKIKREI